MSDAPTRSDRLALVRRIPWWVVAVACLTLGLAPFRPQPHLVEKVGMLVGDGTLAPVDWFDLALHASPWLLLALRVAAQAAGRTPTDPEPDRPVTGAR